MAPPFPPADGKVGVAYRPFITNFGDEMRALVDIACKDNGDNCTSIVVTGATITVRGSGAGRCSKAAQGRFTHMKCNWLRKHYITALQPMLLNLLPPSPHHQISTRTSTPSLLCCPRIYCCSLSRPPHAAASWLARLISHAMWMGHPQTQREVQL